MAGTRGEKSGDGKSDGGGGSPNSLRDAKKRHIQRALTAAGNDLRKAAALLEVPEQELRRLMRELEVKIAADVPKRDKRG